MYATTPLPTELVILGLSVLLLIVHILIQGQFATAERGLSFNAGPRDEAKPPLGRMGGRAQRTLDNFKETYPGFVAAVLAAVVAGRLGTWSEAGVWLWLVARIAYLPLYLLGVPYIRTLAWLASVLGILLVLYQLT